MELFELFGRDRIFYIYKEMHFGTSASPQYKIKDYWK